MTVETKPFIDPYPLGEGSAKDKLNRFIDDIIYAMNFAETATAEVSRVDKVTKEYRFSPEYIERQERLRKQLLFLGWHFIVDIKRKPITEIGTDADDLRRPEIIKLHKGEAAVLNSGIERPVCIISQDDESTFEVCKITDALNALVAKAEAIKATITGVGIKSPDVDDLTPASVKLDSLIDNILMQMDLAGARQDDLVHPDRMEQHRQSTEFVDRCQRLRQSLREIGDQLILDVRKLKASAVDVAGKEPQVIAINDDEVVVLNDGLGKPYIIVRGNNA